MALSGTVNTSAYGNRYLQLTWSATQSIPNNSSTISWTLKGAGGGSEYYYVGMITVKIAGVTVYSIDNSNRFALNKGTTVASNKLTVNHGTDGTKSISISVSAALYSYSVNISGSNSYTLNQIPRASDVTCPSNFTIGEASTISLSRKSTTFTHTATTSFGDEGLSATTDIATSFTYTPPISLFNSAEFSDVYKRDGTITVQTKSGTTDVGSALVSNITVTLPENETTKPTCSLSNVFTEYGTSYLERYGVLIANKSRLQTTCAFEPKLSSSITNHYFTIPGSSAIVDSNNNVITDYLKASSSQAAFSYYVKDSRGFISNTSTVTNPYQVVEYRTPSITSLSAVRVNESGVEDPVNGTNIRFKVNYFVDPVVTSDEYAANSATVTIYLVETDEEGNALSRERVTSADGSELLVVNGELTSTIAGTYPIANSFIFEATIVDEITTEEAALGTGVQDSVLTAKALMSFYQADGITFGRIAEKSGFNVAMDSSFEKTVTIGNATMGYDYGEKALKITFLE